MKRYFEWGTILFLLFIGFLELLIRMRAMERLMHFLRETGENLDEQERRRLLEKREQLALLEGGKGVWIILERELEYSGLKRLFPGLSVGRFLMLNVMILSAAVVIGTPFWGILLSCAMVVGTLVLEWFLLQLRKAKNLQNVNEELVKFLDFLGNYSLTAGELTGVLAGISRYLREPLQSVLETCEMESRLSGDVSMALLSMADRVEHPQFKQLARNMEITCRYGADFSALVEESRRSLRDYQRQTQERRTLLFEAAVNMGVLLLMSVLMLTTVNYLIDASVWDILFHTIVGYVALGIFGSVIFLFLNQVMNMNK